MAAQRHLAAFVLERNPWHVIDAYLAYRKVAKGLPVPDGLLERLDTALAGLLRGSPKKPRGKALRNAQLVGDVLALERSNAARPAAQRWTRTRLYKHVGAPHGLGVSAMKRIMRLAGAVDPLRSKRSSKRRGPR